LASGYDDYTRSFTESHENRRVFRCDMCAAPRERIIEIEESRTLFSHDSNGDRAITVRSDRRVNDK